MTLGIRSYKHLNKILVDVLRIADRPMTAKEIEDYIINHYKTKKVNLSSILIAKRLQFLPHVERVGKHKGAHVYKFVS